MVAVVTETLRLAISTPVLDSNELVGFTGNLTCFGRVPITMSCTRARRSLRDTPFEVTLTIVDEAAQVTLRFDPLCCALSGDHLDLTDGENLPRARELDEDIAALDTMALSLEALALGG
jgi:hypothetical protein